jgi:hypothetical protein
MQIKKELLINAQRQEPNEYFVYSKYLKFEIIIPEKYFDLYLKYKPDPIFNYKDGGKIIKIIPPNDKTYFESKKTIYIYFVRIYFKKVVQKCKSKEYWNQV